MLALVNAERKATNDHKRIERELFDSLRRDKVDSIQKMQVNEAWCCKNNRLSDCFLPVCMWDTGDAYRQYVCSDLSRHMQV